MSKINQIQTKLTELDGGAFQKLADAYLHKKGYEQINSLGSVIGADKVRKGTPDTLMPLPNGKYVFAEYTTQQSGIYEKLKKDLDKCFDEEKTGIAVEKIDEVVICYTSTLKTSELDLLREQCQKLGVNLNIFGIDTLSYDLYQKYPGIARDFLGIEVDTRQILTPDDFVTAYDKNAIATPLSTTFHFREEELAQVLQELEESNLVVVSGKPGVGKSRFVLECCDRFVAVHPEYKVQCIFLRGVDIFEDLRVYFAEPGSYLIFVDDANRVSRFEYFIQLLHDQREDQQIKVIATVRDYALEQVREVARSYQDWKNLELHPLEEQQIKQLVKDEYGIINHLYSDRIVKIAKGNPRLAIMAAAVAKRENTLESISNVSSLYDEYYGSIRRDIEELGDENILKAAGIVAFFRTVDYSNKEMMGAIEEAFGIPQEVFWTAVRRLDGLEVLDMYENEVVRTSDQVLATYFFYLAFFKNRSLDFAALIKHFFPRLQYRLVDVLNPVLNTFDSMKILEVMRPHVDRAWETYEKAGDEVNLMHFMQVFWLLKQTDILLYVSNCISKIEPESVDVSKLEINHSSNLSSPSLLSTLGLFSYSSDENNLRIALVLLFDYLIKRSSELSQAFYLLTKRFGFEYDSCVYEFIKPQIVIDEFWKRVNEGKEQVLSKLFLAVGEYYLQTQFNTTKVKGRSTLNIIELELQPTPEIIEWRRTIWKRVFQLYQISMFQKEVLDLLHKYCLSGHKISVNELITQDAVEVIPFIESQLDSSSYCHCIVVQDYLDHLENHQVAFSEELRDRFTNETYALSKVLLFDWGERKNWDLEYEEYEQRKGQQIEAHFTNYCFTDYKQFFEQCLEIQGETDRRNHNQDHFPSRVVEVLIALADRDGDLYVEVLEHYLNLGDPLKLYALPLVNRLMQIYGVEKAYKFLNQLDYPSRREWLFGFYRLLPQEEIKVECLAKIYELYRESAPDEMPQDLHFLLKYCSFDENVVVRVVEIILEKIAEDSNYSSALSFLFKPYREVNQDLLDPFKNYLDLLKKAYLAVLKTNWRDGNGQIFTYILDLDPNFIFEYIDWIDKEKEQSHHFHGTRDYSFLWRRENYEEMMSQIVEYIYTREQERRVLHEKIFILPEGARDNDLIEERQNSLLTKLIEKRPNDFEFIRFLFGAIGDFSDERRFRFIALFLKSNNNFEEFEKLPLEPATWSWQGSAVPMYQTRVKYFESLLQLLNTVDFLQHKQYVERYVHGLRERIEQEKKKNFMEN
ncbi:nSTAND3 domain-containing NTPase [Microcoleus sp. S13C4]|uniref:nSTAND3 domain-containing NTPase n=1 Tax=Microcoleus sp. S13C4 TaxID=3055410 RepID=UPI002FD70A74